MIRWLTAALVLGVVACGGGGGGGGGSGGGSLIESLWPVAGIATNTVYTYSVSKTVSTGAPGIPEASSRSFLIGHNGSFDTVARFFGFVGQAPILDTGASSAFTTRGLEAIAFGSLNFSSLGGPCVTVTTPGMLVAPSDFKPGDTHLCSLPGLLDTISIHWVGPEASPGHADAQRFDLVLTGPYSSGTGVRAAADNMRLTGSVHLAPGIGLVDGQLSQEFRQGTSVLMTRAYTFGGLTIQPPP